MLNKRRADGGAQRLATTMLHRIAGTFPVVRRSGLSVAGWVSAALCAVAASLLIVPGKGGLFGAGLAVLMAAIAAIDMREFRIPNELVAIGALLGLAEAAVMDPRPLAALASAVVRGAVLALLLLGFRSAYRFFRHREGLGLGDVKLCSVAGVWLSWTAAALAIEFAAIVALATVLIGGFRGKSFSRTTPIPFGLFFAPAIWFAWLLDVTLLPRIIPG